MTFISSLFCTKTLSYKVHIKFQSRAGSKKETPVPNQGNAPDTLMIERMEAIPVNGWSVFSPQCAIHTLILILANFLPIIGHKLEGLFNNVSQLTLNGASIDTLGFGQFLHNVMHLTSNGGVYFSEFWKKLGNVFCVYFLVLIMGEYSSKMGDLEQNNF